MSNNLRESIRNVRSLGVSAPLYDPNYNSTNLTPCKFGPNIWPEATIKIMIIISTFTQGNYLRFQYIPPLITSPTLIALSHLFEQQKARMDGLSKHGIGKKHQILTFPDGNANLLHQGRNYNNSIFSLIIGPLKSCLFSGFGTFAF